MVKNWQEGGHCGLSVITDLLLKNISVGFGQRHLNLRVLNHKLGVLPVCPNIRWVTRSLLLFDHRLDCQLMSNIDRLRFPHISRVAFQGVLCHHHIPSVNSSSGDRDDNQTS